jgi:hypothetical protein
MGSPVARSSLLVQLEVWQTAFLPPLQHSVPDAVHWRIFEALLQWIPQQLLEHSPMYSIWLQAWAWLGPSPNAWTHSTGVEPNDRQSIVQRTELSALFQSLDVSEADCRQRARG